jgi:alkylation response protein AidB-like acyl-CoA dehydrogenase
MTSTTTAETTPDATEYRERARAWLADHVPRREGPPKRREVSYYTPEVMAANRALQRTLYEGGYAGISWPKEYGGGGLPVSHELIFQEEAQGYALPEFGVLSGTTFGVCVPTMLAHAAPEFLSWFVPKVLAGEALVCQFFSEPSGGSDLAGARTSAVKDGDQWVLNGQKIWSTYAHLADWGMCLARTDWDVPKHSGLTWFAVPCDSAGLTIRPIRQINDTAEFCEDFFDDVAIPDFNRIGEVNKGWTVTQTMLIFERGAGRVADRRGVGGPGTLAPDLVRLARRAGAPEGGPRPHQRLRQPDADRSHRRDGPPGPAQCGRRCVREALRGHLQPHPGPDRGRDRRRGGDDMGTRRGARPRRRPHLPQRSDHVDRRGHQRGAAKRDR